MLITGTRNHSPSGWPRPTHQSHRRRSRCPECRLSCYLPAHNGLVWKSFWKWIVSLLEFRRPWASHAVLVDGANMMVKVAPPERRLNLALDGFWAAASEGKRSSSLEVVPVARLLSRMTTDAPSRARAARAGLRVVRRAKCPLQQTVPSSMPSPSPRISASVKRLKEGSYASGEDCPRDGSRWGHCDQNIGGCLLLDTPSGSGGY